MLKDVYFLEQSFESRSTEHEPTISVSEIDEFDENQSVYSDSLSISNKSTKSKDFKKSLFKINKLKEENAALHELLSKANASDIAMLKSKLRSTNADIVRLRQTNSDLKDKIQILESKLFESLYENKAKSKSGALLFKGENIIESERINIISDVNHGSDFDARSIATNTLKHWQTRCNHLTRLVKSYEKNFSVMQVFINYIKIFLNLINVFK